MRFRVFIKPTPSQKAYYHIFRFAQRTADILCIICIRNSLLILIGFLHFRVYQIHKSVKGDIIINPDFPQENHPCGKLRRNNPSLHYRLSLHFRSVKGLTTAAGLWAGACLGLALGAGFYSGAIVGFFTLWCAMRILHSVDKLLSRTVKVFSIYVEFAGIRELSKFLSYGREVSCIIDEIQVTKQKDSDGEKVVAATMTLHFARAVSHEQIIEEFGKQEGVLFILEV